MLSALGGWLKLRDVLNAATPAGDKWTQITTMGRDHFVRIVTDGYLCPTGHKAALVQIAERQFLFQRDAATTPSGEIRNTKSTAFLIKRTMLVIREKRRNYATRDFDSLEPERRYFRLPFESIDILTEVTPLLDPVTTLPFWPKSRNMNVDFDVVAIDWSNTPIHMRMPMVFVPGNNLDAIMAIKAVNLYNGQPDDTLANRTVYTGAQRIAYTPTGPQRSASVLITDSIVLTASFGTKSGLSPRMSSAVVRVPEVAQISSRGDVASRVIVYSEAYKNHGFETPWNKAEVFAQFEKESLPMTFPPSRAGIATPNFTFDGLSRINGLVPFAKTAADLAGKPVAEIANGKFIDESDLGKLLPTAKLLGVISLKDILEGLNVPSFDPSAYEQARLALSSLDSGLDAIEKALDSVPLRAPSLTVQQLPADKPTAIRTTYVWKPILKKSLNLLGGIGLRDAPTAGKGIQLLLVGTVTSPLGGGDPQYRIEGKLSNFELEIANIIGISFESFRFISRSGQKLEAKPVINDISFKGALGFLNELQKWTQKGLGGGFSIDVRATGLTISYSLSIPSIGIGIFSLQNLRFSPAFHLAFVDGEPMSFLFAFSSRSDPFRVSVSLFAGGGFFAVELDTKGIRVLEASIEFGGTLELDLFVAKGSATVMAGLYFRLDQKAIHFEGYYRVGACLEVLQIITVSVEFYVGLSFDKLDHEVILAGVARVTVEISVMFFSTSAELELRVEYRTSGADPTYGDVFSESNWLEYCDAFAADGV